MKNEKKYFIGIGGGTGSGKTTIAKAIEKEVNGDKDCMLTIPLDNYYKDYSKEYDFEEREKLNYDHPSAFEWELVKKHISSLKDEKQVNMPVYDFKKHKRSDETVLLEPRDTIITEGIFALYDKGLREMYDLKIYVDTPDDIRLLRRAERDMKERGRTFESVKKQYLDTVRPMHERFVRPTKEHADIILPEGVNDPSVDLLSTKLREMTQ